MLRNLPLFRSQQKKRTTSVGSVQFLNRFSAKLEYLPFSKIIRKFWLKVKWNGKVCGKLDWKLQTTSTGRPLFSVRSGTAEISLPFRRLSSFQSLISRQQLLETVSVISFGCIADCGETPTISHGSSQPVYSTTTTTLLFIQRKIHRNMI